MQLQMPFFKVSRPFLGPIKMSEVRIPQLSLNFFIDFFFSSLVYLKPQCVLSAEILLEEKKAATTNYDHRVSICHFSSFQVQHC